MKKILIGIGNPGNEYKKTYHSLGILFANFVIEMHKDELLFQKNNNHFDFYGFKDFSVIISKVFMNQSELVVKNMLKDANLLVAHDELGIKKFKLKIKTTQGNNGHNGLRSISKFVQSYDRFQIGIDHPKNLNINIDVTNYVLGKMKEDELSLFFKEFEATGIKLFQEWVKLNYYIGPNLNI